MSVGLIVWLRKVRGDEVEYVWTSKCYNVGEMEIKESRENIPYSQKEHPVMDAPKNKMTMGNYSPRCGPLRNF